MTYVIGSEILNVGMDVAKLAPKGRSMQEWAVPLGGGKGIEGGRMSLEKTRLLVSPRA